MWKIIYILRRENLLRMKFMKLRSIIKPVSTQTRYRRQWICSAAAILSQKGPLNPQLRCQVLARWTSGSSLSWPANILNISDARKPRPFAAKGTWPTYPETHTWHFTSRSGKSTHKKVELPNLMSVALEYKMWWHFKWGFVWRKFAGGQGFPSSNFFPYKSSLWYLLYG